MTGSCPKCGSGKLKVLRTERPRRRIACQVCKFRFSTIEVIIHEKNNGGGGFALLAIPSASIGQVGL